jgi:hypothetical protein
MAVANHRLTNHAERTTEIRLGPQSIRSRLKYDKSLEAHLDKEQCRAPKRHRRRGGVS